MIKSKVAGIGPRNPLEYWGWLAGLGMTSAWLVPLRLEPWPTFLSEIIVAVAVGAYCFGIFINSKEYIKIDYFTAFLLLVATIPVLQSLFGFFLIAGEAGIISLYVLGFALCLIAGRTAKTELGVDVAEVVLAAMVPAAIISAGIAVAQWSLHDATLYFSALNRAGDRPGANIGQPNELATLLVWGLIGLLWLHWKRSVGVGCLFFTSCFLLFAVCGTQSRVGVVNVAVLYLFLLVNRNFLPFKRRVFCLSLFFLLFLLFVFFWNSISTFVNGGGAEDFSRRLTSAGRVDIWMIMIYGVMARPWFGYGWDQGRIVQLEQIEKHRSIELLQHAHNIFLDLMVWNGFPLGIVLCAFLMIWILDIGKKSKTSAGPVPRLGAVFLLVFFIHALLELVHTKLIFLAPVGFVIGSFYGHVDVEPRYRLKKWFLCGVTSVLMVIIVTALGDYVVIQREQYREKLKDAQIYSKELYRDGEVFVLTGIRSVTAGLNLVPYQGMPVEELQFLKKLATRYPVERAMFNYYRACELNGLANEAASTLKNWCALSGVRDCSEVRGKWSKMN